MQDPTKSRSGRELVPLRRTIDADGVTLACPEFEPLTAAQEAEAVELLVALFATAASRGAERGPLREAA